jgi:hypothetical protein
VKRDVEIQTVWESLEKDETIKETTGDNAELSNGEGDLNSYSTGHQPREYKLEAVAMNLNQVKGTATIIGTRGPEPQIALVVQLDDTFFGLQGQRERGPALGKRKSNATIISTDPDSQRQLKARRQYPVRGRQILRVTHRVQGCALGN